MFQTTWSVSSRSVTRRNGYRLLISSFPLHDIRANSMTPLAPVLLGASGYMKEVTAEQKSLDSSRSFVCVGDRYKGDTQGGTPWEIFASFASGQRKCRAA